MADTVGMVWWRLRAAAKGGSTQSSRGSESDTVIHGMDLVRLGLLPLPWATSRAEQEFATERLTRCQEA